MVNNLNRKDQGRGQLGRMEKEVIDVRWLKNITDGRVI